MTVGTRFKEARKAANVSVAEIARLAGMAPNTLYDLERGTQRTTKKIVSIAGILGVRAQWLESGRGPMRESGVGEESPEYLPARRVPLVSWVRAGDFDEAVDSFEPGDAEEWLPCPAPHGPNTYALKVRGDSMTAPYGRTYPDGTVIFVDPDKRSPPNGGRIIAKLNGSAEVTFKCYVHESGRSWLKPLNPQHPPITDEFKIIGTVVGSYIPE